MICTRKCYRHEAEAGHVHTMKYKVLSIEEK